MRVAVLAIGLALTAGHALADDSAAEKDADKEKIVCKQQMKANSRFTTRVCLTRAEWEFRAEQHRKAFQEVQNRPVISIAKGN